MRGESADRGVRGGEGGKRDGGVESVEGSDSIGVFEEGGVEGVRDVGDVGDVGGVEGIGDMGDVEGDEGLEGDDGADGGVDSRLDVGRTCSGWSA